MTRLLTAAAALTAVVIGIGFAYGAYEPHNPPYLRPPAKPRPPAR